MADINLRINGDGSGADDAFQDVSKAAQKAAGEIEKTLGDASKKSSEAMSKAWEEAEASEARMAAQLGKVQTAFLALGAAAVKFGVDSVRAFAEADRVQRQLERAAGGLAEAFGQQADALESQLAVDGELIKQQQTLLLQWGAAPEAIEGAVRAINDYAAATGKDAVSATTDFLQAVEKGDTRIAKYGVTFEQTGDKAKDFTALTEAMTKALGGASAARAQSLEGGLEAVAIAFGNVQEAFGKLIADINANSGILDKMARGLQGVAAFVGSQSGLGGLLNVVTNPAMLAGAAYAGLSGGPATAPAISGDGKGLPGSASYSLFDPKKAAANAGGDDARVARARKRAEELEKISAQNAKTTRDEMKAEQAADDAALAEQRANYAAELQSAADFVGDRIKLDQKLHDDREALRVEDEKRAAQHAERMAKEEASAMERATKDALDRTQAKEREARAAADAIGAAFVNALAGQLAKLAEGGEFDAAMFVGEILAATVGIAGGIIGTAFGAPAVGAAVGNLAAMGIRAGFGAMSAAERKSRTAPPRYHSGGWVDGVDVPRYHSGGWLGSDEVPMIGQKGERMLSRGEVSNMGGREAVDSAAKGGARVVVNVTAIDAKSAADGFVDQLGRGMRDALNRGQGALPQLLGVGPR